jgi:hypothetical protein
MLQVSIFRNPLPQADISLPKHASCYVYDSVGCAYRGVEHK